MHVVQYFGLEKIDSPVESMVRQSVLLPLVQGHERHVQFLGHLITRQKGLLVVRVRLPVGIKGLFDFFLDQVSGKRLELLKFNKH